MNPMSEILNKRIKKSSNLLEFLTNQFNEAMFTKDYETAKNIARFKINIQLNRFKCKYFISFTDGIYSVGLKLSDEILYIKEVSASNIEIFLSSNFGIKV